jgi:DNA repair exonuclease SbcCD ATPase subunit
MRIKECASCGAARGKKVEDRLDVVLSDRSGAAEDLAGIAVMLAASELIRSLKESCFGVACLDEPFGALDKANRKAFAHGLVTMLRDGWEQVFVVAHDDALMDAMPGRIVIEASDEGSCVRVG